MVFFLDWKWTDVGGLGCWGFSGKREEGTGGTDDVVEIGGFSAEGYIDFVSSQVEALVMKRLVDVSNKLNRFI